MKQDGQLFESEGAWWMRTTDYGDDKDRVVIKSMVITPMLLEILRISAIK